MNLLELLTPVTTFVFDVDGVLTDGTLFLFPGGEMVRRMNIKDGYALQLAVKKGYRVVIISGGHSELVKDRLERLGVSEVFMQVTDKKKLLGEYMQLHQMQWPQVIFMGDDIPDADVMQQPGIVACCPADAATEIKQISHYISPINGGMGCAREIIEKVMKLQGSWQHVGEVASR
ncbi:MAG: 3-deoxy-D-manno-octulosonate 8-phosphate phosphatase [Chitinophagaceae bacterium]